MSVEDFQPTEIMIKIYKRLFLSEIDFVSRDEFFREIGLELLKLPIKYEKNSKSDTMKECFDKLKRNHERILDYLIGENRFLELYNFVNKKVVDNNKTRIEFNAV